MRPKENKGKGYHFKCVKCKKHVDSDAYCFGCKQHICEECCEPSAGNEPVGAHPVEEHWTPYIEEEW